MGPMPDLVTPRRRTRAARQERVAGILAALVSSAMGVTSAIARDFAATAELPDLAVVAGERDVPIAMLRLDHRSRAMASQAWTLRVREWGAPAPAAVVGAVRAWWDVDRNGRADSQDVLLAEGRFPETGDAVIGVAGLRELSVAAPDAQLLVTYDVARSVSRGTVLLPTLALSAASARKPGADVWLSGRTATIVPSADVSVAVSDDADPVANLERFEYRIDVRNHGPDVASAVRVRIDRATSLPPIAFTPSQGSCPPTASGFTDLCALGALAPGSTARITGAVAMPPLARETSISVSVSAPEPDPDPSNNVDVEYTRASEVGGTRAVVVCFIATAAYGSASAPEVQLLRGFRDRVLLKSAPGRAFVAWYYRVSPRVAVRIAERPALRAVVRGALAPVVLAIAHPGLALACLLASFAAALAGRVRRRRRQSAEPLSLPGTVSPYGNSAASRGNCRLAMRAIRPSFFLWKGWLGEWAGRPRRRAGWRTGDCDDPRECGAP